MPYLSGPEHRKKYVPANDLQQQLAEIGIVLAAVQCLRIREPLKKSILRQVLWEIAYATGNTQSRFLGRYRTERVMSEVGLKIQRDHVYRRETLVRELLSDAPDLDSIIVRAQCRVVTKDEHDLLDHGEIDGWERYHVAGIAVYDMLDETRVDLSHAPF